MEFNSKNKKAHVFEQDHQRESLFNTIREAWKRAGEDQLFFNSRLKIFDYLSSIKNIQTAIVEMHVKKTGITYEVVYDLYFTTLEGKIMETKGFHVVNLTKSGFIPFYIIDEVMENGAAEIRFHTDDIDTLFKERSIKINESISYTELLDECKNSRVTKVVLKDRVFYTRIEFFNNETLMDSIHVAEINGIPDNVNKTLYPCGAANIDI